MVISKRYDNNKAVFYEKSGSIRLHRQKTQAPKCLRFRL